MPPTSVLTGFSPDSVLSQLPGSVSVYVVGGAIRDELMGRSSIDKDWVVVGASVDNMLEAGFTPVGVDFPVFLHPKSKEEYALARTERKSGHGYKGFTFHADPAVTLQEDLARRDFTVNAMAVSSTGDLIDPYAGQADLRNCLMRHVSPAFVDDPLRVLRLARFLARFLDFSVAEETMALCYQLRDSGELKHLVAERIYAELNKGMGEEKPSRMIAFLNDLNAWCDLANGSSVPFSGFDPIDYDHLDTLTNAEDRWVYALGFFLDTQQIRALVKAWRLPRETGDLAVQASQFLAFLQQDHFDSTGFGLFFTQADLYRKPERLQRVNRLVQQLLGPNPVHVFVQNAVEALEQGHFKAFLSDRLAHMPADGQAAQVAAAARQAWVEALYSRYF